MAEEGKEEEMEFARLVVEDFLLFPEAYYGPALPHPVLLLLMKKLLVTRKKKRISYFCLCS